MFLYAGGQLENSGTVVGGDGAGSNFGSDGAAAVLMNGGQVVNHSGAAIDGGHGGTGTSGGSGGAGIRAYGGTITNQAGAGVTGGDGGDSTAPNPAYGSGDGGVGVQFVDDGGGTLINHGSVSGGNSGTTNTLGAGGVGVVATDDDVTIINDGSIVGGLNGDGTTHAHAVELAGNNSTLELRSGYQFTGDVVASGNNSKLVLGGANNAGFDLDQLGTSKQYQGFDAFEKTGTSTWTLTGAGSQDWTVDGGTLLAGVDGAFADGTAYTVNSGTLDLGGFDLTMSTLSGSGGQVDIDNADLMVDQTTNTTYAGSIGGYGKLLKTGVGMLTLTGTSSYAGGTTVGGGTLIGDTDSLQGDIVNYGRLVFDQSANGAYAGVISAAGWLIKKGSGILIFSGDSSTFTGQTDVNVGTLIVGGATGSTAELGGNVMVQFGATLGGHGTIGGKVVNAGTVSPGNSIGTLTINGDYRGQSTSVYTVEVNAAGQHDLLDVAGHAQLNGGTVDVQAANGSYQPQTQYIILKAGGGRAGHFGNVTSNLAFLDPSLVYGAKNVVLTLMRNDTHFSRIANTPNQVAAASGAGSLGMGSAVYKGIVGLSAPVARQAFDALSGEYYASAATAMLGNSRYARTAVSDRLARHCAGGGSKGVVTDSRDPACGGQVWLQAYGNWSQFDGDGNAAALDSDVGGFFLGADKQIARGLRLGFVAGYGHASNAVDARRSSGSDDSYRLGLYGSYNRGPFAVKVGVIHAWHDLDSTRHIRYKGFADDVSAEYDAHATQVFAELGYGFDFGDTTIEPFVRGAYVHLKTDGFTEQGGAAALDAESSTNEITTTLTGLRLSHAFDVGSDATIHARGMLGWRHNYGDTTADAKLAFAGGDTFSVAGVPLAEDALAVKAGLGIDVGKNLTLDASYVGQFGGGVESNGVTAGLVWQF